MPRGADQPEYLRMFGYDPSWFGVSVLFMLAGWLALRSLQRHGSPWKFLISRIGRNLPLLAVFAASVPLILFPLFGTPPEPGVSRLSQHLSYFAKVVSCFDPNQVTPGLLDNALYMCIIQGGLWTFRWGLIAYIATAVLWKVGAFRHRNLILLYLTSAIVSYVGLMMYGIENPTPTLAFLATGIRLGFAFLVGMCAFTFRDKLPKNFYIPAGLLTATLLQYFILPWTPMIEVTASLALGYLAFVGFISSRPAPGWVRKLPDLSLGLYVFNWPIAQLVLLSIPSLAPLALFAISFPLTVALSVFLWMLFSRKINMRLNKYTRLSSS